MDDQAIYRLSQKLGILRVILARERRNEMKEKGLGQNRLSSISSPSLTKTAHIHRERF